MAAENPPRARQARAGQASNTARPNEPLSGVDVPGAIEPRQENPAASGERSSPMENGAASNGRSFGRGGGSSGGSSGAGGSLSNDSGAPSLGDSSDTQGSSGSGPATIEAWSSGGAGSAGGGASGLGIEGGGGASSSPADVIDATAIDATATDSTASDATAGDATATESTATAASDAADPRSSAGHDLDGAARHRMISEAAHRRYRERNYADGYDFEDWLSAEAEIDDLLQNRSIDQGGGRGG